MVGNAVKSTMYLNSVIVGGVTGLFYLFAGSLINALGRKRLLSLQVDIILVVTLPNLRLWVLMMTYCIITNPLTPNQLARPCFKLVGSGSVQYSVSRLHLTWFPLRFKPSISYSDPGVHQLVYVSAASSGLYRRKTARLQWPWLPLAPLSFHPSCWWELSPSFPVCGFLALKGASSLLPLERAAATKTPTFGLVVDHLPPSTSSFLTGGAFSPRERKLSTPPAKTGCTSLPLTVDPPTFATNFFLLRTGCFPGPGFFNASSGGLFPIPTLTPFFIFTTGCIWTTASYSKTDKSSSDKDYYYVIEFLLTLVVEHSTFIGDILIIGFMISGLCGISIYWSRNTNVTIAVIATFLAASSVCGKALISVVVDLFPTSLRYFENGFNNVV
uniref:(California timema) hypothetical protein n=1 Tax=Timema californicum TaxID=61474 RepID=A0A7R9JF53_TIMCA|nr:unnamed protein product [Timema californicum]